MYLTAIIDWYSSFIVGYELSDTLDTAPVLAAVTNAMEQYGNPEIINSDQGSQFTSNDYIEFLKAKNIRQSMDEKARWVDNVVIERWPVQVNQTKSVCNAAYILLTVFGLLYKVFAVTIISFISVLTRGTL